MKKIKSISVLILLFILIKSYSWAQNCNNDSTGLIPLNDLLTNQYQGYTGGLYFGSNTEPGAHALNLQNAINTILPLNSDGIIDQSNGKIVLLSIGASNPKTEFENFKNKADTFTLLNPFLKIVNGCKGGSGIQGIKDSTNNYWSYVANQLSTDSVNKNQVQIIWLEEDNTQNNNDNFPAAPQELMLEFKQLFQVFLHYYPNLKICYLNGRGYSGYVDSASSVGNGLRQPRDYYQGWAMKWLIENQISGDTALTFSGPNRNAPLLDWGSYLWADGKNERQDGLKWECPQDVKPGDGLHWSPTGNEKAGKALFEQFKTDPEAKIWFMGTNTTSISNTNPPQTLTIYPNPSHGQITISTSLKSYHIELIEISTGKIVYSVNNISGNFSLTNNKSGLYDLKISTKNHETFHKIISIIN